MVSHFTEWLWDRFSCILMSTAVNGKRATGFNVYNTNGLNRNNNVSIDAQQQHEAIINSSIFCIQRFDNCIGFMVKIEAKSKTGERKCRKREWKEQRREKSVGYSVWCMCSKLHGITVSVICVQFICVLNGQRNGQINFHANWFRAFMS